MTFFLHRIKRLACACVLVGFSLVAVPALAQGNNPAVGPTVPTQPTAANSGPGSSNRGGYGLINPLGNRSVPFILGQSVSWFGGFAGSLFLLYLMWGGITWMTAAGDGAQVKKAQSRMVAAVSGIIVVLLAYMIVSSIVTLTPQ